MADIDRGDNIGLLQRPYVYLLLLAISVGLITLAVPIIYPNETLQTWLSRLTISIVGAYLTVSIVDIQIRKREEAEIERQRNLALHQLHSSLNNHLNFLCELYIVSSDKDSPDVPESFDELFDDEYIHQLKHLDFSKDCNTLLSASNWHTASHYRMSEFKENVGEMIVRYGQILDSTLLGTLLKSSENALINSMASGNLVISGDMNILNGENYDKALEIHLDAILKLISYYNDPRMPDLESVEDKPAWEQAHPGSARMDVDLEETEPSYGVKNLEEDRYSFK